MITRWYGTFLVNDDRSVEKSILFPSDPQVIANRLKAISNNEILEEERELLKGFEGAEHIILADNRLKPLFKTAVTTESRLSAPPPEDFGYELTLLQQAALLRSREQIVDSVKPERHIIHAINSIDELNQTTNLLSERLREWYGLHWPELAEQVDETGFVKLILEHGTRDDILSSSEEKGAGIPSDITHDDALSLGGAIDEEDMGAIKALARVLNEIYVERDRIEKYAKLHVEKIAPNASRLAGPLITAKLIALSGGMERLARVSASTIQLLGAEKALFRHLKDGSSPPKHGIIFQHPLLHSAPYWQRGKIARALATKISIAIRIDFFSGEYKGDNIEEGLKKRIGEIKSRYPSAPQKPKEDLSKKKSSRDAGRKSGRKSGKSRGNRDHR